MARYRVFLNGRNLRIDFDGCVQLAGFWVNCCVEAATDSEAGEQAIKLAETHDVFGQLHNGPDDASPIILVTEIERLPWYDRHPLGRQGFTFYLNPDGDLDEIPLA